MKRTIALILCCTVIYVSGTSSNILNDKIINSTSTAAAETISTASTTKTPNILNPVTPSRSNKTNTTATVVNNTSGSATEVPKTATNIVSIPKIDPKPYKWIVNGTNSSIIVQMAVRLIIVYHNSTSKQNVSVEIDVPANNSTQVYGNFTQNDEIFKLSWKSIGDQQNYVLLHFWRSMNTYSLYNLEVSLDPKYIPDNKSNSTLKFVHTQEHFNTSIGNSYRCIRLQTFNLTRENDTAVVGYMKVSDLQFQAFKTDKKSTFGLAEDCAFDTPDVVPIAVGCVLAGLVIIVLAAYLISRRRSEARGYLSM